MPNEDARFTHRTVQGFQLLNARRQHPVDVPAELLAFFQCTTRHQEQRPHGKSKHAEANGYAPSDAPLDFPGSRRVNHVGNLTREGQLFAPLTFSAGPLQSCVCTHRMPLVVRGRSARSSGL